MRTPPKDKSPAPLAIGGRAQQSDQVGNRIGIEDNIGTARLQTDQGCLASAYRDSFAELVLLIDRIKVTLAWRDDLQRRVRRALLELAAEIKDLNPVCYGLAASFSKRRTT